MRYALVILAAFALFACAPQATARPVAPASAAATAPAAVAQSFFDALRDERWDAAAGHLDLDRFARYLSDRFADIERLDTAAIATITPEQMMRHEPEMPREVAEYFANRATASRAKLADHVLSQFAGVPDRDSLRRLPVRAAAARWLEAHDLRYQMRRAREELRQRGCELPEEEPGTIGEPRRQVVGAVLAENAPGDTVAYVLHRDVFAEAPTDALVPVDSAVMRDVQAAEEEWYVPEPAVVVLHRSGGEWKVLPSVIGFGPGGVAVTIGDCGPAPEEKREP